MLFILEEWKHLERLERSLGCTFGRIFRIGIEISTSSFMQSTDSEKKTLINKTKRLKAFVLLVLLHLGISLTRAQLREASPPLQREVSEQSSHRLYSIQAFLILCVS